MKLKIQNFLEISTIHGLSYMTKRFHVVERIFWITALVTSVICTSILIAELVLKIRNLPIVVYLSDQSIPVSEINFPAVTFCSPFTPFFATGYFYEPRKFYRFERHTLEKYFYEDREFWWEIEDERKLEKMSLSRFYYSKLYDMKFLDINYSRIISNLENGDVKPQNLGIRILKRLQVIDLVEKRGIFSKLNFSVPADDFLDVINQFGKEYDKTTSVPTFHWITEWSTHISEILTPHGLCLTFNMPLKHNLLHLNSTSNDFHYEFIYPNLEKYEIEPQLPDELPRKISTSKEGLHIFGVSFHKMKNNQFFNKLREYTVILHDPFELPSEKSKIFKFIVIQCAPMVLISPQSNVADESVKELELNERNCYLNNEKVLKFFKVYTKSNCETECLHDFMLSRCGCIEFFMIRNQSTRICSASEKDCFDKAKSDFEELKGTCRCLRLCDYVQYDFEMVKNELSIKSKYDIKFPDIKVRFKFDTLNQLIYKKQFDTFDFLSFVGGILGLFAGFSALSFVELLYWFTARFLIENFTKFKTKVHPVDENTQNNSKMTKIKQFCMSYFDESSIHGLKYILEFTSIDSMLWILFILSSMTLCIHMISSAGEKVPNSRVIAFDDNFRVIKDIPYPAFTLVPGLTLKSNEPQTTREFLRFLATMPDDKIEKEIFLRNLTMDHFCLNQYDLIKFGINASLMPYVIDMLKEESTLDWFRDQFSSFNGIFQPKFAEIRTSRGMGFAFNMIDVDELLNLELISAEYNYSRNVTTTSNKLQQFPKSIKYPLTFSRQNQAVLTFKLNSTAIVEAFRCTSSSFLVHQSDHMPTFNERSDFVIFDEGTAINIEIVPEIIRTDDNLRKLEPKARDCYFEGEKSLKFFKKYSQSNCELECITNITVEICGCVDINQPFMDDPQFCLNDQKGHMEYCTTKTQRELLGSDKFSLERNCSCLPTCNSVTYNVQYFAEYEATEGNETTINVKMNMDDIVLYRRYQQFTSSDVVSYVGGLLGLFAGISMLSIVEFLYFFTMRLGVSLWRIFRA